MRKPKPREVVTWPRSHSSEMLKRVGFFATGFQVFYIFVLFPQHVVVKRRAEAAFLFLPLMFFTFTVVCA